MTAPNNPPAPSPAAGATRETTGSHSTEPTVSIYDEIAAERAKQDAQWGGIDHDDTHHAGEWWEYRKKFEERAYYAPPQRRDALLKIAALAVAQIESLDRQVTRVR